MIEIKNKQILIDGKPQLIMCGEIHYFRLKREEWQDRINKVKEAGCNTVASYIPWICHEPEEGQFDLDGRIRPELDLAAFIDLCKESGLYFFLRPGPFIMAEMKNEGVPYWVYEKYPEVVPVTWDKKTITTKTLDYLAPNFLRASRNWYKALAPIVVPRLYDNGGNIIAVQLDNEVGMLSWVSNSPDLTDNVIADFIEWLKNNYKEELLKNRYAFDLENEEVCRESIRLPKEEYSAELMKDLGYYMRNRLARYIAELRKYAEELKIKDIPFIINIHGTDSEAERGTMFPIGISQLYESYTQAPGYLSGSDLYLGNFTLSNFQDLYVINAFMDAVHNEDQPLTSVEFECGDGDYYCNGSGRFQPSAADLKTRMCIAQGNKLINYYLFAGGRNYRFENKQNDGNDRIAFTGERHGFAAPVNPEGELSYTYPRMASAIKTMMAVADKLSVMQEEHDDVAVAFIPDYYMTESRYPNSQRMSEIVKAMEANRIGGTLEIMTRAMLLAGYRFGAVDVQNKPVNEWKVSVLAIATVKYMSRDIQQKLSDFLKLGGRILLHGEIPQFDMEGKPCSIVADTLGVKETRTYKEEQFFYLSVYPENWASPRPETRAKFDQAFKIENAQPIFRIYGTDEICGFDANVGSGRAVIIGSSYDCDVKLFKKALETLGAKAGITHDYKAHGIFTTSMRSESGERFLHILNLDSFDKEMYICENDEKLFGGYRLLLQSTDGVMLPINVSYEDVKIVYSTAEIINIEKDSIEFRLTQKQDIIALETSREIAESSDYSIKKEENKILIFSNKHAKVDDRMKVCFKSK